MSMNKKEKNKFRKFLARTFVRIGIALTAVLGIGGKVKQLQEAQSIEEDANLDVGRNFRNINEEKMNEHLKEQLDALYQKYPNLDELINSNDEAIQNKEFIKDMYTLYKVNLADEKIDNIQDYDADNLKVVEVDRVISQSDRLYYDNGDNTKKILETSNEKYKMITDKYNEAMDDPTKSKDLANTIYELLVKENGLKDNIPTSSEIDKLIDKNDFRDSLKYDVKENDGEKEESNDGKIVLENNEKDINEKE